VSRKKISPHFWLDEFACGCCGSSGDKKNIIQLTSRLEMLRRRWNKPMKIVGGHRCLKSNPHGATNAHYLCTYAYLLDETRASQYMARFDKALAQIKVDNQRAHYGTGSLQISSIYQRQSQAAGT
jgi:hypothetical protein